MALDRVRTRIPTSTNRQDTFSHVEWMHENSSKLPLVRRVPTLNIMHQDPDLPSTEKVNSTENVRERVPVSVSSSTGSSSGEDSDFDFDFDGMGIPHQFHQVSASQVNQSDSTIHFSLDVADDIEGHLEEVSRLKRWGHFHEAIEYFTANLEQHMDLPLVLLELADLSLEQGSYHQLDTFVFNHPRWDPKTKRLPISSDEKGPDLYGTDAILVGLRKRLSFTSFPANKMDLSQGESFCEYLNKRATSRRGTHSAYGDEIPFDSTEVQIIRNHLEIQSEVRCKGKTPISGFDTRCWPELYDDLLMGGRIWELCDLLLAMFHFFGLTGTWERLFHTDEAKKDRVPQTIHCLERLFKDWTIDEYDEATELAILTIVVEIMYMLDIGSQSLCLLSKDLALSWKRCAQQAEQCAADIKEYSPQLTRSRPYLQWVLAKEHFNRLQNRSTSYGEQREKHFEGVSGLVLNKWCLPIYIPVATENPGWPSPDPEFPPNEQLQWALKTSQELQDYKTRAMVLRELICRVEDPRPLFKDLDQLHGHDQEDLIQLYESCTSQYLLTTDDSSHRELLRRLQGAASHFEAAAKDDVCVATRWNGLMVQNALARSVSNDAELIEQNAKLEQSMREGLPYTQKALDNLAQAIIEENEKAKERANQSKKNRFAANSRPGDLETGPSDQSENYHSDSRFLSYDEYRKSRTRENDLFKEDVFHRLDKLELEILQHKKKALEEELRRTKIERELEQLEFKERLKAEEEKFREKLRERILDDAPSQALETIENKKNEPTWEQPVNDGDKGQARQPMKSIMEKAIPQTHWMEDDDNWASFVREPRVPQKSYRYASIEEIQDELTVDEKRGRPPAPSGTTEPPGIFEEPDELDHDDGVVGENGRPSGELEARVHVEEKASSEDEGRSRPYSSTRSSSHDSRIQSIINP